MRGVEPIRFVCNNLRFAFSPHAWVGTYRKIQRIYPDAKKLVQPRIAALEKEWFLELKKLEKNSNPAQALDLLSERAVKRLYKNIGFGMRIC